MERRKNKDEEIQVPNLEVLRVHHLHHWPLHILVLIRTRTQHLGKRIIRENMKSDRRENEGLDLDPYPEHHQGDGVQEEMTDEITRGGIDALPHLSLLEVTVNLTEDDE